jgi:predicted AAA+ superfamily ATPase
VVVTGARQTGKTTLVSRPPIGVGRTYLSLDDLDVRERALQEPGALVRESERLTLDEVQRAPNLLHAVKQAVDADRAPGRFLLTGSANLLMMRRISESLAGRAVYLDLWPMTESEKKGRPHPGPWSALVAAQDLEEARGAAEPAVGMPDVAARLLAGGYPVAALSDPEERAAWFDGYVRTYLERDLQEIATIAALSDFRRLMKLSTHRIGQVLNQADLARDAALAPATAHRYLNLLETSFQIVRIPAYAASRTKRLVKSPKLYWTDTGLAAHLAGIGSEAELASSRAAGALVENLVLTHLLAWRETEARRPEIHFYRTAAGHEVDFAIERGRQVLPIEVKSSRRVSLGDARFLESFLDDHPRAAPFGLVLYGGERVSPLSARVLAVPLGSALPG